MRAIAIDGIMASDGMTESEGNGGGMMESDGYRRKIVVVIEFDDRRDTLMEGGLADRMMEGCYPNGICQSDGMR